MSKSSINIININEAEKINDCENGSIIVLLPDTARYNAEFIEKAHQIFEKDPKIGAITCDLIINPSEDIEYIEYFLKKEGANVPIILKKAPLMKVSGPIKTSDMIKAIVANGFYIEHIADPEVRLKNERAIY